MQINLDFTSITGYVVKLLVGVVAWFMVHKLNSIHDDIKEAQTKEVCREFHKANAQEHEDIRKDAERNESDVRELRERMA